MASVVSVRAFEAVCVGAWLVGLYWVLRQRRPVYSGVYFGSSTLMVFDWVFNTSWFFRVVYAEQFVPLWKIQGVVQPVALACNYAFFFGAPVLMLVHQRAWLDRRLGTWGPAAVFAVGALLDLAFEIPMVKLGLWTYYQRPAFLLGGVPWSNFWYSGMLMVAAYAAARLAVRWGESPVPAPPGGGAEPTLLGRPESWWRGFAMGAAAIWAAFYVCISVQLVWYGATQPWIPSPRPF
ncbi:hypothetical protein [Myxococcus sp. RHSTA-1-4]|uniref:hypothetical protein n=1 Tax=Myxococcus sp. RHSTA-1-4 TaxID=2874601 RepID=UPI001CC003B2|nr:hypothetical protein [Myxococcus sp. RHSTA-1-4]MBZ4419305.1 hypothetical protein [Myxococcus sp. RHSTA-1-4]